MHLFQILWNHVDSLHFTCNISIVATKIKACFYNIFFFLLKIDLFHTIFWLQVPLFLILYFAKLTQIIFAIFTFRLQICHTMTHQISFGPRHFLASFIVCHVDKWNRTGKIFGIKEYSWVRNICHQVSIMLISQSVSGSQ